MSLNHPASDPFERLRRELNESGYSEPELGVLLKRLRYCFFADRSGLFQPARSFHDFVAHWTSVDVAAVGPMLAHLFQVLNTPTVERARNLEERLATFPVVGQKLFAAPLPIASFDEYLAHLLLECSARD